MNIDLANLTLDECLKLQQQYTQLVIQAMDKSDELHELNEARRKDYRQFPTAEIEAELNQALEEQEKVTEQLARINERVQELSAQSEL